MKLPRALLTIFAIVTMVSTAGAWESRATSRKASYPQIYDCSQKKRIDLTTSTAFRTRYSRFIAELADSARNLRALVADTGSKKEVIITLRVDTSGKVDSSSIDCADSSCVRLNDSLQTRLHSWRFGFSPSQCLLVIQDISAQKKNTQSFYRRNWKKIGGCLAIFVVLLLI
jgi:hypothetical protein